MNNKQTKTIIARRHLLKIMATTGGVITVSNLSTQWMKPIVEVGLLPTHAQTSPEVSTLQISNLSRELISLNSCTDSGSTFVISFEYDDLSGNVNDQIKIHHTTTFLPSGVTSSFDRPDFEINGNSSHGIITYTVCTGFGNETEIVTSVILTNSAGHESNELTITTPKPVGASGLLSESSL